MKKSNLVLRLPLLSIALIFIFSLAGCDFLSHKLNGNNNRNRAPTVSLTVNDETPYSDQTVTLTANASDPDGDSISYTWYINGVRQGATSSQVTYTPMASSNKTDLVEVDVMDDESSTGSDSLYLTVTAAASLHVVNNSSYSVYYLYMRSHLGTWSSDLLSSNIILSYNSYKIYGIMPVGNYDFRAETSGHALFWDTSSSTLYYAYGTPRTFTLTNSTWTLLNIMRNTGIAAPSEHKAGKPLPSLKGIPSIGEELPCDYQFVFVQE